MKVLIEMDKSNWQFLSKEESGNCEVVNTKTKLQFNGVIVSMTSSGKYYVELKEQIQTGGS